MTATGDRIFITNIAQDATQDEVQEYFSQYGSWTDIFLPKGNFTAGHKGICFISFENPASVAQVMQNSPHVIRGQQIVVDVAVPRDAKGGKGAGGFNPGFASPMANQIRPIGGQGVRVPAPSYAPSYAGAAGFAAQPAGSVIPGRLFLTKMSPEITKDDLSMYFGQYGELDDLFIPSGGKLIAFVGFKDALAAAVALQVQIHEVKEGCTVCVDAAMERPPLGSAKGQGKFRQQPF